MKTALQEKIPALLAISSLLFIFTIGCASLPPEKSPGKIPPDKKVTIKLERANVNYARIGGSMAVSFGKDIVIHVPDEWESTDGWTVFSKAWFNDKAVFTIPAGEYEVKLDSTYRIWFLCIPLGKKRLGTGRTSSYKFEPGSKYKLFVFYEENKGYRSITKKLGLSRIEKVDSFN